MIHLVLLTCALAGSGAEVPRPRVPLTTSKVVGWPDPPPPYRTRQVFEKHAFKAPVYLASHPAHDLIFLVELGGRILCLSPNGKAAPTEFVKIPEVDTYSMAFHPRYASNRLVYIFCNGPVREKSRKNQILKYRVLDAVPPRCDPASKQLVIEWVSNGHNGGDLAFGPDGMLYVSAGDGTSDSDTDHTGQDLRDLCSGILRIDVDQATKGASYTIPRDNPFLKIPGARGELWSFGMRNPWRMTFDPEGNLLVADVGQDLVEMVHIARRGSNHGWSVMEGSRPFQPLRKRGPAEVVVPLIEHPHSESRSITGGVVYQGKRYPSLRGTYVYGDYSTGKIWGLKHQGGKVTWRGDLAQTRLQMVGFGADRDGELYIVDHTGSIHQLVPTEPGKGLVSFPRTLGESGLFRSVKEHRFHPGLIPYEVNSPLWSDGTQKDRAIALPGTGTIGFTEQGPWQFPERTVLVKTFSLESPEGTRKRIETRFLTLQEGEWFGYSYAWDDDQQEARLVDAQGMDRSFAIRDPKSINGKGTLAWHYPSRVECMVCHTRAAGYVLGLTTAQMNRGEQLRSLESVGLFHLPRKRHWEVLEEMTRDLGFLASTCFEGTFLRGPSRQVGNHLDQSLKSLQKRAIVREGTSPRLPRYSEALPRLANPHDGNEPLESRIRSYLHANCSHCHVWAGGGNSAIDLHMNTARNDMKLIGLPPLHDRLGIADAKLVAPGSPERSILLARLQRRGRGQMPPLGTQRPDPEALLLLEEWIRGLR